MSDVESLARRLLDALKGRPDLWHELLRLAAADKPVLGPWKAIEGSRERRRFDAAGKSLAVVAATGAGMFKWTVYSNEYKVIEQGRVKGGERGAMEACDGWLVVHGYTLAGKPPHRTLRAWSTVGLKPGVAAVRRDEIGVRVADIVEGPPGRFFGRWRELPTGEWAAVRPGLSMTYGTFAACQVETDKSLRRAGFVLRDEEMP